MRIDKKLPRQTSRIIAIDVARAVAIIGMIVLHALPPHISGAGQIFAFIAGEQRPQILFAVLDGVSLSIIAHGAETQKVARQRIAIRAIFLIAIGMFLGTLGSGVIVILDYYGVFFLLSLPLLFLTRKVLLILATVLLCAGPLITWILSIALNGAITPLPVAQISEWLILGTYPALMWMPYVMYGMVLFPLLRSVNRRTLFIGFAAGVISCLGYGTLSVLSPAYPLHAIVQGVSGCSFCVSLILLLAYVLRRPPRLVTNLLTPITQMGAAPASIYTAHVILFAVIASSVGLANVQGGFTFLLVLITCLALPYAWRRWLPSGPLESLTRWMTRP